ncbi:hypothetical protein SAMN05446935_1860 [Burkholderia sp. YR290]|jgi:hypothetical protein|nr:hypothetical protein SAMN05192544_105915 [Paraburkholderia hospita]SOE61496.1 hypothetical protein SAMN05446935_1860 [Burkholderia sp. YR290]
MSRCSKRWRGFGLSIRYKTYPEPSHPGCTLVDPKKLSVVCFPLRFDAAPNRRTRESPPSSNPSTLASAARDIEPGPIINVSQVRKWTNN